MSDGGRGTRKAAFEAANNISALHNYELELDFETSVVGESEGESLPYYGDVPYVSIYVPSLIKR